MTNRQKKVDHRLWACFRGFTAAPFREILPILSPPSGGGKSNPPEMASLPRNQREGKSDALKERWEYGRGDGVYIPGAPADSTFACIRVSKWAEGSEKESEWCYCCVRSLPTGTHVLDSAVSKESAMVGTKLTPIRLVRSKLRKREEASAASRDVVAMQTLPPPPTAIPVQGAPTTMLWQYPVFGEDSCQEPIGFPLPAVQPNTSAVTTTPSHPSSLGRVRINLRGQWKKWIKRKPSTEIYTIPAELRPQLKHMYVY
ncbi:hypothetical protein J437_LFUL010335 [Ladona fulva]|uniref:Uncharacterized protein n=1 Tax=Ladona fulva TaxID=123851 RepID=A0A8K0NV17_LADFU|nr:hypothetical protein J437_LFUL010335 [Ladona fulva]